MTQVSNQNTALQTASDASLTEQIILGGDLSKLNPQQRVAYYKGYCERIGLDPFTKPFDLLKLNGKEVLYLTRAGAQQLNKLHNVSHVITDRRIEMGVFIVTAEAYTPDGRRTASIGAVPVDSLKGEALCNAMMKAETKGKRRATLDLLGLGVLDETETTSIPNAQPMHFDPAAAQPATKAEVPADDYSPESYAKYGLTATDMDIWSGEVSKCNTTAELKALYEREKEKFDQFPPLFALLSERKKAVLKAQSKAA